MRIPTCFRGVDRSDTLHERSLYILELLLSFALRQDVLFERPVANLYCLVALSLHTAPEFVGSISDVDRGVGVVELHRPECSRL